MGLLEDYANQAVGYDRTRGASQAIVTPLLDAVADAPGGRLLDVGGGTGNYADALRRQGFNPLVLDRSDAMLKRARAKDLPTIEAEATDLPVADDSFDVVLAISMLHHVDDPQAALAEMRRALAPGGILVALAFTREDAERLWVLDLFPSSREWMTATHRPLEVFTRRLPNATVTAIVLDDIGDASLAALSSRPDLMLEREWRAQASYFERMERDHSDELAAGLERLATEVAAGTAPTAAGTATLLRWVKPG